MPVLPRYHTHSPAPGYRAAHCARGVDFIGGKLVLHRPAVAVQGHRLHLEAAGAPMTRDWNALVDAARAVDLLVVAERHGLKLAKRGRE